ncbi:MlaD family protein [Nocardia sp. NPDC051756]|uniref:MlaD family protein n=1 Tax=Nocardia sp. NPDC051756 TaxID=3154751 RepID=UPI003420F6DA
MPTYGIPGVSITKRRARIRGLLVIAVITTIALTWTVATRAGSDDGLILVLRTEEVGDGIVTGTQVRLDGVAVGQVERIDISRWGAQQITLRLNSSRLPGVTDNVAVNYAPTNLFGISEIALKRRAGGAPLHSGQLIDLSGDRAAGVQDVTMGNLIRSLSRTTTHVLTPQLTETLTTLAADLEAFTPLLEAMITTGQIIADTQVYPASFLLGQYGSTLAGAAPMITGTVQILDTLTNIDILKTQRPLFDVTIKTAVEQLFPVLADLLFTAQRYADGYAGMLTPVFARSAQLVPTPQLTSAQLRELLARLDNSFTDAPGGPMLNLALTLRGVPAVSVPLLGNSPQLTPTDGGGR